MIRYRNPDPSAASMRPGRSGLISFSTSSPGLDALQAVSQELGVEADLERFAGERHGQRLAGLADVGRLGGDRELALTKGQPQRRVLLRQQADAAHHVGELAGRRCAARARSSRAAAGGSSGTDRRSAATTGRRRAPRRRPGWRARPRSSAPSSSPPDWARRTSSCSARAGTLASKAPLSSDSSGVSLTLTAGRSPSPPCAARAPRPNQDAGEDRTRLVARGRARHAGDGLDERGGRELDDGVPARLGQRREVLAAQGPDVEGGGAGLDLDVLVGRPQLERDLRGGERTDDVQRQPRRHDRRSRAARRSPRAGPAGPSPCRWRATSECGPGPLRAWLSCICSLRATDMEWDCGSRSTPRSCGPGWRSLPAGCAGRRPCAPRRGGLARAAADRPGRRGEVRRRHLPHPDPAQPRTSRRFPEPGRGHRRGGPGAAFVETVAASRARPRATRRGRS